MKDFYTTLSQQSLENALDKMKNNKPADDLLKLLRNKRDVKNNRNGENVEIQSKYKLVVGVSEELSDVDDIGENTEKSSEENDGGEATDSKRNQPRQEVKGDDKPLGSFSEYEYLEDDDDVKDK